MGRADEFASAQIGPVGPQRTNIWDEQYHKIPDPRLFPVSGHDFRLEPHQQTREQFASDPRTWWHGRYGEQLPRTGTQKSAGIHVGTEAAARIRQKALGTSTKTSASEKANPTGPIMRNYQGEVWLNAQGFPMRETQKQPYRFFPVRLAGPMTNTPETPAYDEGNRWHPKSGITFYRNDVEDRGSISALVPKRAQLQTHGDLIKAAQERGETVHPNILWEQKAMGGKQYAHGIAPYFAERPLSLNRNVQPRMFDPPDEPFGNTGYAGHRRYQQMTEEATQEIGRRRSQRQEAAGMTGGQILDEDQKRREGEAAFRKYA